jgi:hypothetical protein
MAAAAWRPASSSRASAQGDGSATGGLSRGLRGRARGAYAWPPASRRDWPPATGHGPRRRAPARRTVQSPSKAPDRMAAPGRGRRHSKPSAARRARVRAAIAGPSWSSRSTMRQRVAGDAGLEAGPALALLHHVALEVLAAPPRPARPRWGGRRVPVGPGRPPAAGLGRIGPGGGATPTEAKRSHSLSQTRRPMAASSTERVAPLRWAEACRAQMVAHLTVA